MNVLLECFPCGQAMKRSETPNHDCITHLKEHLKTALELAHKRDAELKTYKLKETINSPQASMHPLVRISKDKYCQADHPLRLMTTKKARGDKNGELIDCNKCNQRIIQVMGYYTCENACNFDLCNACYDYVVPPYVLAKPEEKPEHVEFILHELKCAMGHPIIKQSGAKRRKEGGASYSQVATACSKCRRNRN